MEKNKNLRSVHEVIVLHGEKGVFFEGRTYQTNMAYDVEENARDKALYEEVGHTVISYLDAENSTLNPSIKFMDRDDPNYRPVEISQETLDKLAESDRRRKKNMETTLVIMRERGITEPRYTWLL